MINATLLYFTPDRLRIFERTLRGRLRKGKKCKWPPFLSPPPHRPGWKRIDRVPFLLNPVQLQQRIINATRKNVLSIFRNPIGPASDTISRSMTSSNTSQPTFCTCTLHCAHYPHFMHVFNAHFYTLYCCTFFQYRFKPSTGIAFFFLSLFTLSYVLCCDIIVASRRIRSDGILPVTLFFRDFF